MEPGDEAPPDPSASPPPPLPLMAVQLEYASPFGLPPRSALITAVAIIGIVLACLSILSNGCGSVSLLVMLSSARLGSLTTLSPNEAGYALASGLVRFALALALLSCSIGLHRLRHWSRKWMLRWALTYIVAHIFLTTLNLAIVVPGQIQRVQTLSTSGVTTVSSGGATTVYTTTGPATMPFMFGNMMGTIMYASALIWALAALIYPVAVLIVLRGKRARALLA